MLKTILKTYTRPMCYARCYTFQPEPSPMEAFDDFTRVTALPSGVRVVTEEKSSPLTCVSLFVMAGARYETKNFNGMTHLIEHLAYKGIHSMKRAAIECSVLTMGARMTAKTKRDMQVFSMIAPSGDHASAAVDFFSKLFLELELDDCELDMEKTNICRELVDLDNNPKAVLFDYLHAAAFQGTALGQPAMGPSHNVLNFDRNSILSFLNEHYTGCSLILATSGSLSHDKVLKLGAIPFEKIHPGLQGRPEPGPGRFTASEILYRNDSMPYAHVILAVEAPGYGAPDFLPMYVAHCMIGSWHKSQGRPMNHPFYTAQGAGLLDLCQSYEAFYKVYQDVGLWGVYFVGNKLLLDEMIYMIQHAWLKISVMPHSAEVQRGVNMAKLKFARRYDGVINSCFDVGNQIMYTGGRKPLHKWNEAFDIINSRVVMVTCEKYVLNQGICVVGMGPTESIPEYNRTQAGMYWLRT